jgi:hypothetical protein
MGGGGIICVFKGKTDAIITRGDSPLFGRVGHMRGYTVHSYVIHHVWGGRKLIAFLDAALLNVYGAWPILSKARPRLGSHLFFLKGQYGGLIGRVTRLEPRRSILVLIPQVRLAHNYPISPWEMIHPPGGDNPVRI